EAAHHEHRRGEEPRPDPTAVDENTDHPRGPHHAEHEERDGRDQMVRTLAEIHHSPEDTPLRTFLSGCAEPSAGYWTTAPRTGRSRAKHGAAQGVLGQKPPFRVPEHRAPGAAPPHEELLVGRRSSRPEHRWRNLGRGTDFEGGQG